MFRKPQMGWMRQTYDDDALRIKCHSECEIKEMDMVVSYPEHLHPKKHHNCSNVFVLLFSCSQTGNYLWRIFYRDSFPPLAWQLIFLPLDSFSHTGGAEHRPA